MLYLYKGEEQNLEDEKHEICYSRFTRNKKDGVTANQEEAMFAA